jgi:outer membrane protein assembly factor BamA
MKAGRVILLAVTAMLSVACAATRSLADGEYLLQKNKILVNDRHFNANQLNPYIRQKSNVASLYQGFYNLAGKKDTKFNRFLRRIGTPPVVYDPSLVDVSIDNLKTHLGYLGYYGSDIDSRVTVRKKKVTVFYFVTLGHRIKINGLSYDIPDEGTLLQDFNADKKNVTIKPGQFLSEQALEAESLRSSNHLRTIGYYGINKSNYFFVADTLTTPGEASLKMSIKGDQLNKFYLDSVRITHPERLRLRPRFAAGLNTLRPGALYDERAINTTYSRFTGVNLFSGVNVALHPTDSSHVSSDITLQHSRLQGFKTNLEFSVNSSALIGILPQITYYHKNIFHGGELLNVSFMGNFQFHPKSKARSTEFGVTASLRFPTFLGLPNRIFKGPYIPKTDITAAFNYQDRPEFKRTMISASYGYSGNIGERLLFQLVPVKLNIVRIFNMDPAFAQRTTADPFLQKTYSNHFDLGLGGTLFYTTNPLQSTKTSYHYYRTSIDLSGNLLSAFNKVMKTDEDGSHLIWGIPYSQYVRAEVQAGRTFVFGKKGGQSFAYRFLVGAGYAYGNSYTLPFEKAFYSGGASSLRGWQARAIGPGRSGLNPAFSIPSQTGDWKFEANVEYRFGIVWKLEGALFADAGNVWSLYKDASDEERFSWDSIAADWGVGIRLNMDFLVVRVDFGMQVHDPATLNVSRGWVGPKDWFKKGNCAVHFGVGYPF